MKRILVDVDTQFDFMEPDGSLYVSAGVKVYPNIAKILADNYDAVIGSVDSHAYDSWEFQENGGPFPSHCIKGQRGWLRVFRKKPSKQRFIPMTRVVRDVRDNRVITEPFILAGENRQGEGFRYMYAKELAFEAVVHKVGLYFEKEVYSLFDNQMAHVVLDRIGLMLGGNWNEIQIDVIGYCLGGYCVDAAVEGLCRAIGIQRANIRVLAYATAAIGGEEGMAKSKAALTELGAEWVEKP